MMDLKIILPGLTKPFSLSNKNCVYISSYFFFFQFLWSEQKIVSSQISNFKITEQTLNSSKTETDITSI